MRGHEAATVAQLRRSRPARRVGNKSNHPFTPLPGMNLKTRQCTLKPLTQSLYFFNLPLCLGSSELVTRRRSHMHACADAYSGRVASAAVDTEAPGVA